MATNNASRPTSESKTPAAARKAAPKAAAARPASARATAARPASRAKAASKSKGPGPLSNLASSHRSDLVGIGWAVLAVLVALGTYTKFIGPFGNGVTWLGGVLVGIARFALPILFALIAVASFSNWKADHPTRLAVGSSLFVLSILGLLHVKWGPVFGVKVNEMRGAGGLLGIALGRPLQALLADAGAVIVLVALILVSLLIATRTSVRSVASTTARGITPGIKAARGAARNMSTLASERLGNNEGQGAPSLYDVASEDDDAPAARKTRAKKNSDPGLPPPDPAFLVAPGKGVQTKLDLGPSVEVGSWKLPPQNLLTHLPAQQIDMSVIIERGNKLQQALASHGVETTLVGQTCGPTVTRYELELGVGVKVASVTSLNKDIAYAMASPDVRILAPIPGRSAIGVEVPNVQRVLVTLGDVLHSPQGKAAKHPLEVAVGKGFDGSGVMMNLANTPHMLIAGATGAGKSSGINCIVTSILMRTSPDDVKLILIDPKQVEMGQYARLPHLLTQPVTNPKKAANALAWAVREMENRYDILSKVGFRDITGYNAAFDAGEVESEPGSEVVYKRMPFILIVVDELNDLMMVAARDVEESVTRIAQKARAVGIHLIVATQRPSVNVITGVIKANIPARMAFAVSSLTDSRVILDQPGAERLVGKGDMLLLGPTSNVAQRIQGCFVGEDEVRKVVAHWRKQAPEPVYAVGVEGDEAGAGGGQLSYSGGNGDDDDDETLVRNAMELIVRSQLGSTSMLQRKLKVGFARAGRIMDLLEQRGVVGPSEGSKARAVLMTVEEFEQLG
jgi:DNA segregation ATPase FtsK/SpoIIIE, S-DNA-T family